MFTGSQMANLDATTRKPPIEKALASLSLNLASATLTS